MPLLPPSSGIRWKNHQVSTPTFELSPVEKPDMSPFLFHMTGKRALSLILAGTGDDGCGFLKAMVPKSDRQSYKAAVVCFTESPSFALDFFRYRTFDRWQGDQRFGIGFDKGALVKLGVRPCVYADQKLNTNINYLHHQMGEISGSNIEPEVKERLLQVLRELYPLTTPILEHESQQGYMWEREWRYFDGDRGGIRFPYEAIKVICCPEEEQEEIQRILGRDRKIAFVRSWLEYDEVTAYFKRRQGGLVMPKPDYYADDKDFYDALVEQLDGHSELIDQLQAYDNFATSMVEKKSILDSFLGELQGSVETIKAHIQKIKNRMG